MVNATAGTLGTLKQNAEAAVEIKFELS